MEDAENTEKSNAIGRLVDLLFGSDPGVAHDAQSRARVIELFEELGRVDLACHGAGVGRRTHYQWMETDPDYRAAFEAAGKRANDCGQVPVSLPRPALHGWPQEPK